MAIESKIMNMEVVSSQIMPKEIDNISVKKHYSSHTLRKKSALHFTDPVARLHPFYQDNYSHLLGLEYFPLLHNFQYLVDAVSEPIISPNKSVQLNTNSCESHCCLKRGRHCMYRMYCMYITVMVLSLLIVVVNFEA